MSDDMPHFLLDIIVKKINISTDLKIAYRAGILAAKKNALMHLDGFQPAAVEKMIQESILRTVKSKLDLLSGGQL